MFSTRSDTEVILHGYEEYGKRCIEHFRGIFAFAIWDSGDKSLFLARNRLGIKPVFYAEYGGGFSFASEMKAILSYREFPREIDDFALSAISLSRISLRRRKKYRPCGYRFCTVGYHFFTRVGIQLRQPQLNSPSEFNGVKINPAMRGAGMDKQDYCPSTKQ